MSTIAEVFLGLEAAVLLVGLLYMVFAQEIVKLVGLWLWFVGTPVVFVLFLIVSFIHDHLTFGVH